jgi:cytochrome bd-type quinol oxidase subunit 1
MLSSLKVLNGASVSLTGRNLWIIHKNLPNADPEQTLGAGNLGGYQGGNMPAIRNLTLNFQLNF